MAICEVCINLLQAPCPETNLPAEHKTHPLLFDDSDRTVCSSTFRQVVFIMLTSTTRVGLNFRKDNARVGSNVASFKT